MTVTIEKQGRRYYVRGNTYAIKDRLKDAGCKWDADARCWYTGKKEVADKLAGTEIKQEFVPPTKDELAEKPCSGKVEYKGRNYYVVGHSQRTGKLWLTVLDCSIDFWAAESDCKWVKHYAGREDYRSGRVEHQTVGGIRRFIEREKSAKSDGYDSHQHRNAVHTGRCMAPGCGATAGASGYCQSCEFDEFDN
jgi:hypothetical protein